jgi:HSP20 family molecular chaperone IbpA
MAKVQPIPIRAQGSIANAISRLNEQIMRRAYQIFEDRGGIPGSELDNWLTAENELVWKPPIELSEKNNELLLSMAVPGVDPRDIQVEATPEELVVRAETRHEHREDEGPIHSCEFHSGSMFRVVRFPKRIDPDHVRAEFKNGMLKVHAPVSVRSVEIDAA